MSSWNCRHIRVNSLAWIAAFVLIPSLCGSIYRMTAQLIFLPGFGTDERLFDLQLNAFEDAWVASWLEAVAGESMRDYALRLSKVIADRFGDQPVVLVGVSMGGMVSLEVARHGGFNLKRVLLVSSCTGPGAIDVGQRWFARMTSRLPESWIASMRNRLPRSFYDKLGSLTDEQSVLTRQMFMDTPTDFLKWGCGAMAGWRGVDPETLGVPVKHIHGDQDLLIRSSKVRPDVWIQGAGHAANLTHAEQVNAFIREHIVESS